MDTWNELKDSTDHPAHEILDMKITEDNPEMHSLISHFHKLHEITGLNPREATVLNPVPETPAEFDLRCLEKVAEIGKLDEVKL
jgi:hypothetical protein